MTSPHAARRPRGTARGVLSLAVSAVLAASAATFGGSVAPASAATAHRPVLFVHGWQGSTSTWTTMISRFKSAGYVDAELFNWSYNSNQSNATTAQAVNTKVDQIRAQTGWDRIDIVTHSMGGLSTRYYLKNLGGAAEVDDWVSLGGPNHGTTSASGCWTTSCYEMRIGSSFLTALNSGDETPGATMYSTWWSPCDNVINPDSSVSLVDATNTQTACLSHSALTSDATVFGQVKTHVDD